MGAVGGAISQQYFQTSIRAIGPRRFPGYFHPAGKKSQRSKSPRGKLALVAAIVSGSQPRAARRKLPIYVAAALQSVGTAPGFSSTISGVSSNTIRSLSDSGRGPVGADDLQLVHRVDADRLLDRDCFCSVGIRRHRSGDAPDRNLG